ncbi:MAG: hypothetical protein WD066_03140 [Planctomycetaceae bacterium]
MVINLDAALETALAKQASRRGIDPEALVVATLRARFLSQERPIEPRDEWERTLLEAARDYGVSPPDEALSCEALYD